MANDLATSLEESRSMAAEETPASTLVTLENVGALDPLVIFKAGGIKPILEAIEKEVLSIVPDLSTVKSRKEIASLARKVATSKKTIDGMGKGLADDLNAKLKPINSERKTARDLLDNLRDKARQPLTDWEAEQKSIAVEEAARVAAEELAVKVEEARELAELMNDKYDRDLKEAQEEVAKIAKEMHERELEIEAKRIKRLEEEAAEAARIEAEEMAKEVIEKAEREKREAIEREQISIEREAQAKRDQIAAEERAKVQAEQAEIARVEAEKQAAINAKNAVERARVLEIARQTDIEAAIEEAANKRLADKKHISIIRGEAKLALIGLGLDEEQAKKVVMAITCNEVPHIKITY